MGLLRPSPWCLGPDREKAAKPGSGPVPGFTLHLLLCFRDSWRLERPLHPTAEHALPQDLPGGDAGLQSVLPLAHGLMRGLHGPGTWLSRQGRGFVHSWDSEQNSKLCTLLGNMCWAPHQPAPDSGEGCASHSPRELTKAPGLSRSEGGHTEDWMEHHGGDALVTTRVTSPRPAECYPPHSYEHQPFSKASARWAVPVP